jgi:hypothetical protein
MSDESTTQYWLGVWDTCLYFLEELGFEDAMDTNMAREAREYLAGNS